MLCLTPQWARPEHVAITNLLSAIGANTRCCCLSQVANQGAYTE